MVRGMSTAMHRTWTPEQFLAWEEEQEERWEFAGFEPVAMTGGTWAHSIIQANLIRALGSRLSGEPCRVHGSILKVKAGHSFRYPDAFVACSGGDPRSTVAAEPVVLFEIMSPSTERTDRGVKLREYTAIPSARRYVLIEQDEVLATVVARSGDDWIITHPGTGALLTMPEIGVTMPLEELYEGVDLTAPAPGEALPTL